MMRVGLTGGIGSGKSTVALMLAQLGAAVVDADAISRSVTAAGGTAIAAITEHFGRQFITPDGALDRTLMRARAYADPGARARLEAIVHPLVGTESDRQVTMALAAAFFGAPDSCVGPCRMPGWTENDGRTLPGVANHA